MRKTDLKIGKLLYPDDPDIVRPKHRRQCVNGTRPCLFVGCFYNNYLEVNPELGSIKLNFPDKEPGDMTSTDSCTLDVAEERGCLLEEVGVVLNLTKERVRQIEWSALSKMAESGLDKME